MNLITTKGIHLLKQKKVIIIFVIFLLSFFVLLVIINPKQKMKEFRDDQRYSDVTALLAAIEQSRAAAYGALPSGLTTSMSERQLGTAVTGCAVTTNGCAVVHSACLDLTTSLAKYLKSIPVDPDGTAAITGYSVAVDANNIVTVKACGSEGVTPISASR